jgi:hypothetical protein
MSAVALGWYAMQLVWTPNCYVNAPLLPQPSHQAHASRVIRVGGRLSRIVLRQAGRAGSLY